MMKNTGEMNMEDKEFIISQYQEMWQTAVKLMEKDIESFSVDEFECSDLKTLKNQRLDFHMNNMKELFRIRYVLGEKK
jgi:hypothetical protein